MSNRIESINSLSPVQNKGITKYKLTPEEVQTLNFGEHTLSALDILLLEPNIKNIQQAFQLVSGLNESQTLGITHYGLTRTQVQTLNFGKHTLRALDVLRFGPSIENIQITFNMLRYADKGHITEIVNRATNLGEDTFIANDVPTLIDGILDYQQAFELVSGLNEFRTHGIVHYGLNRTQVVDPRFSESILYAMEVLRLKNPSADGPYLYDTAIHLREYQILGIAENQRTLEELNIVLVDGRFEQRATLEAWFWGNPHERGEARLFFSDDQEQQENIRNIFDARISLTAIQNTENQMRSTLEEATGFASMPLLGNLQNTEEEEISARNLWGGEITQYFPSEGTDFSNRDNSDKSLEDCKPAAKEGKRPKTSFDSQEIIDQRGQNSTEQYQETGGDLERGHQEGQESATMPNEIPELGATVEESFRGLAISSEPPIPSNAVSQGDLDLNNTKPNKKHKLKKK
jgi:hypothetical protein